MPDVPEGRFPSFRSHHRLYGPQPIDVGCGKIPQTVKSEKDGRVPVHAGLLQGAGGLRPLGTIMRRPADSMRTNGIFEESREDMDECVASLYQTEHVGIGRTPHHLPLSSSLLPISDFHAPLLRGCVLSCGVFLVSPSIYSDKRLSF